MDPYVGIQDGPKLNLDISPFQARPVYHIRKSLLSFAACWNGLARWTPNLEAESLAWKYRS